MDGIKPPSGLQLAGESLNFKQFVQQFMLYLQAIDLEKAEEKRKIALFLNCAGVDAIDIYNTFTTEKDAGETLEKVIEKFKRYVEPKKNLLYSTYKFFMLRQEEGEVFDHFYMRVTSSAKKCELGDLEDRLTVMVIVIGLRDVSLKERLLREHDLKLLHAVEIGRASELGKKHVENIERKIEQVHLVKKQEIEKRGARPKDCYKCGKSHDIRNCPAYGRKCAVCGMFNHFASVCKNKKMMKKKVNMIEQDTESGEEFFIGSVSTVDSLTKLQWQERISVNKTDVHFKLDTGADCNTLSLELFNKTRTSTDVLQKNGTVLLVYGGQRLETEGSVELDCIVQGQEVKLKFNVIDLHVPPVLGLPDCERLNLIKRVHTVQLSKEKEKFIQENQEVFTGLGNIGTYKIKVKEESEPVVKPIRRVPHALKDRLKETLRSYEEKDVIEKVTAPTAWCNNLVIVEKPDKSLRLCLDPKELNNNILRENYPIASPEDIYNSLSGKEVFTVLDLKDGFFQVELDDPQKLCTFGTPFGRYAFKRMPFGISSAPEVMQRINCTIFGEIEGVYVYYDDIIIAGKDYKEHDIILEKVIKRAKEQNVRFNSKKIQYKLDHVKYVGLIISKNGIQVDPEHVAAILKLEAPRNIKQLQKFLGMCNYLSKFIPHYTKSTDALRLLLKKDTIWEWGQAQQAAFLELKQKLSCTPTLAMLKEKGSVVLQCDSSNRGLGACLLQDGKPVSFYSRSYTECQSRWAPIEKEMFAICASMEKYHQFVYGRRIIVETDHKPLVAIMSKDINKVTARLQRMRLNVLKYDFEIRYVPGSKMFIADYLSRDYLTNNAKNDYSLQELVHSFESEVVYGLDQELPLSDKKICELQTKTREDSTLQQIKAWYMDKWPENDKNIITRELKYLYKLREFISIKDDIVYFQNKIIIPLSMRKEILTILHTAHAGVVKCKKRARKCLYWPAIASDIESFVLSCTDCEKYRSSKCKETLISHEVPDIPFYKVGMDICHFSNKDYLVVVDYYSKWIELKRLEQKTAQNVILKLKIIFSTHGIPKYTVCDNNPFNSFEFRRFADEIGMQLLFSSPHHHQSNGLAEKAVGIVKNLMKKCKLDGENLNMALLHYRTAPVAGLEYSPSELLMCRLLRTNLPCTYSALKPRLPFNVRKKMLKIREKSKLNYDKTAKKRGSFVMGQDILLQNGTDKEWRPGQIIGKEGIRSYIVKNEKGNLVRRNEKHLIKSRNKFIVKNEDCGGSINKNSDEGENIVSSEIQPSENDDGSAHNQQRLSEHVERAPYVTRSGRSIKTPSYLHDYYQ